MVQLVCFAVELPSKLVLLTQTAEASQDLLVLLKLEHRNAIVWRRAEPDSLLGTIPQLSRGHQAQGRMDTQTQPQS